MANTICAVIVSFKDPVSLAECVRAVAGQVNRIVVIDNGDGRGLNEIAALPVCEGKIHLIRNLRNEGLAAALNHGIRYSRDSGCAWTLLLDQDSIASGSMVRDMLQSYDRLGDDMKGKTAMVVPCVIDRHYGAAIPSVITSRFLNTKIGRPSRDTFVHFHITSGSLIKNDVFSTVGLMNELFFIDYIDFDYCFRVLESGLRILLSREAILSHSLGVTKRKLFVRYREHAPIRIFYQTRNSLFTMAKHGRNHPSFLFFEFFRLLRKPLKIILLDSEKALKLRMYLRGIKDFFLDCGSTGTAGPPSLPRG